MAEIVKDSGCLEGDPGHMTFSSSLGLMMQGRYRTVGQALQWSLAQGGPAMPVFSQAAYQLLAEHEPVYQLLESEVEYLNDALLKDKIKQVSFYCLFPDGYPDLQQITVDRISSPLMSIL